MKYRTTDRPRHLSTRICAWPLEASFKEEWNNLLASIAYAPIFCHLEWLESCFEVYGQENGIPLPIRFVDEKDNLVAMALLQKTTEPGKFMPRRVIRTVDNNVQRFLPLLSPDVATASAALLSLVKTFGHSVDYFEFFKLDAMQGELAILQESLASHNLRSTLTEFNEQPVFVYEGTWESYLAQRTQGHRKKIRRYTRKLEEAYPDYTFLRLRTTQDFEDYSVDRLFSQIMDLYDLSWQADVVNDQKDFNCTKLKKFYEQVGRKLITKNLLDVCLLKVEGQLIAFELNLCDDRSVYLMMGSYHPDFAHWSPGNAILSEIIQDGFKKGYQRLEFGGDFLEYKKLWAKHSEFAYSLKIPGKSLRVRVKNLIRLLCLRKGA